MVNEIIIGLSIAALQLVIGLPLAIFSIWLALRLYDKFTPDIDEWKEIKKGNLAVGIVMTAVILSIAVVIEGGVSEITGTIVPGMGIGAFVAALLIGISQLLISVLAAILAIYIAVRVLDKITVNIDEMTELKNGNTAVAVIMAGVLLAVSFVVRAAVLGITNTLDPLSIAKIFGF